MLSKIARDEAKLFLRASRVLESGYYDIGVIPMFESTGILAAELVGVVVLRIDLSFFALRSSKL